MCTDANLDVPINPDGSWVEQGYFNLNARGGGETITRLIRNALDPKLGIGHYPSHRDAWSTTVFWRAHSDRPVVQYLAEILHGSPVLALGVRLEKMDTGCDLDRVWVGLLRVTPENLKVELDKIALEAGRSVFVKLDGCDSTTKNHLDDCFVVPVPPQQPAQDSRGDWYERHQGRTTAQRVTERLQALGALEDRSARVEFVLNFFPEEVRRMTVGQAAGHLRRFDALRNLIYAARGSE